MEAIHILKFRDVLIALCTILICCTACGSDIPVQNNTKDNQEWKSCELVFENNLKTKSLTEDQMFMGGDAIAIRFENNENNAIGYAIYDEVTDTWNAHIKGNLSRNIIQTCEVIFLGNQPQLSDGMLNVSFDEHVAIYESEDSQYWFDGDQISIIADLKCKTARLKFNGDEESEFEIKGLTYYKSFNIENWEFEISEAYEDIINVSVKQRENCFESDYMYFILPKAIWIYDSRIWLRKESNVYVYDTPLCDIVYPSKSGIVQVPTLSNHEGWTVDTYKQKSYPDITVTSKSSGTDGWSQTQDSHKFYSLTGVHLSFDNILSTGWYSSSTEEEFQGLSYSDGGLPSVFIDNGMWIINDYNKNLHKGTKYHYSGMKYSYGATYYYFQFFTWRLSYKMTNIRMSNF